MPNVWEAPGASELSVQVTVAPDAEQPGDNVPYAAGVSLNVVVTTTFNAVSGPELWAVTVLSANVPEPDSDCMSMDTLRSLLSATVTIAVSTLSLSSISGVVDVTSPRTPYCTLPKPGGRLPIAWTSKSAKSPAASVAWLHTTCCPEVPNAQSDGSVVGVRPSGKSRVSTSPFAVPGASLAMKPRTVTVCPGRTGSGKELISRLRSVESGTRLMTMWRPSGDHDGAESKKFP